MKVLNRFRPKTQSHLKNPEIVRQRQLTRLQVLASILFLAAAGCVTDGRSFKQAEVIERVGNNKETPAWATGEVPLSEEAGKVNFINTLAMSGDARPEACTRAASDSARAAILRHVKDNLTASGQISEASASGDPGVESLIAFLAQGKLSGVSVSQNYWEKRIESDSSGERVLRIFCASKVSIAKTELARQLREATGTGGNPKIHDALIDAQEKFIGSIGNEAGAAH